MPATESRQSNCLISTTRGIAEGSMLVESIIELYKPVANYRVDLTSNNANTGHASKKQKSKRVGQIAYSYNFYMQLAGSGLES